MPGPLLRALRGRRAEGPEPPADDAPTAAQPAVASPPAEEAGAPGTAESQTVAAAPADEGPAAPWLQRGRLRRRLRFVRRARELALRDLGGLVFDLHRFGRDRPDLVGAKLEALGALDRERRSLERALGEEREFEILREPGLASCPRCGVLHPTEARFCSHCGLPLGSGAALPPDHPDMPAAEAAPPADAAAPEPVPGAAAATSAGPPGT